MEFVVASHEELFRVLIRAQKAQGIPFLFFEQNECLGFVGFAFIGFLATGSVLGLHFKDNERSRLEMLWRDAVHLVAFLLDGRLDFPDGREQLPLPC